MLDRRDYSSTSEMEPNKNIDGVVLKTQHETFVDDPKSLDDVDSNELTSLLADGTKKLDNLHIFHSISILYNCLNNLIKLQQDERLLFEFRKKYFEKLNLQDVFNEVFEEKSDSSNNESLNTLESSPPSSPPLKLTKFSNFNDLGQRYTKETTPDSLDNRPIDTDIPNSDDAVTSDNQLFIPIDKLLKKTTLEPVQYPITSPCIDRLRKEVQQSRKIRYFSKHNHLQRVFNLLKPPSLTLEQYLIRIKTYSTSISVPVYIHAAYLIFKLCIFFDLVKLTELNVYRYVLSLIRCLTKILEDVYQKQKSFAIVGGVSRTELLRIEVGFLYMCNFNIIVGENMLNNFLKNEIPDLDRFVQSMK